MAKDKVKHHMTYLRESEIERWPHRRIEALIRSLEKSGISPDFNDFDKLKISKK